MIPRDARITTRYYRMKLESLLVLKTAEMQRNALSFIVLIRFVLHIIATALHLFCPWVRTSPGRSWTSRWVSMSQHKVRAWGAGPKARFVYLNVAICFIFRF